MEDVKKQNEGVEDTQQDDDSGKVNEEFKYTQKDLDNIVEKAKAGERKRALEEAKKVKTSDSNASNDDYSKLVSKIENIEKVRKVEKKLIKMGLEDDKVEAIIDMLDTSRLDDVDLSIFETFKKQNNKVSETKVEDKSKPKDDDLTAFVRQLL